MSLHCLVFCSGNLHQALRGIFEEELVGRAEIVLRIIAAIGDVPLTSSMAKWQPCAAHTLLWALSVVVSE